MPVAVETVRGTIDHHARHGSVATNVGTRYGLNSLSPTVFENKRLEPPGWNAIWIICRYACGRASAFKLYTQNLRVFVLPHDNLQPRVLEYRSLSMIL
jgi:hypothetical protein